MGYHREVELRGLQLTAATTDSAIVQTSPMRVDKSVVVALVCGRPPTASALAARWVHSFADPSGHWKFIASVLYL